MSRAARMPRLQVFSQHYEKIALLVVLLALLGSALLLLIRIGEARAAIERARWDRDVPVRPLEEVDTARFQEMLAAIRNPYQVRIPERHMLVSELRVRSVNPEDIPAPIPFDAEVCPFTGYAQPTGLIEDSTGDGIPDAWYIEYGLDPFDATLSYRDVDGDGFTVREEHEHGTSPIDPEDHPPFAIKFRVEEVRQRPFDLTFQGIQQFGEEDVLFQLNSRARDRTYFVRPGENVEGFTVVHFEPRYRTAPDGRRIDVSVLTLQREDRTMRLVVDRPVEEYERDAVIVSLLDDETFRVRPDDTFVYRDREYNVIDIRRDSVLIHDKNLDKEFVVGEMQPEDRMDPLAVRDERLPDDPPFDWMFREREREEPRLFPNE